MAKIYNEIVIDMNPESSTFKETLYEDSYEGEFGMLCDAPPLEPGAAADDYYQRSGSNRKISYDGEYYYYTPYGGWSLVDTTKSNFNEATYEDISDIMADWTDIDFTTTVGEREDIGVPSITEESWMAMTLDEQAQYLLDVKYQGDIPDQENDLQYLRELLANQPLLGEVDPTRAGFLEEEYGRTGAHAQYDYNNDGILDVLDVTQAPEDQKQTITDLISSGEADVGTSFAESLTGQKAGQALSGSLSQLQGAATKVGGTAATGVGMRAGMTGQKAIKKGFGEAQDVYGLAGEEADLAYREGMYGLEEERQGQWESDWGRFFSGLPDAT